MSDQSKNFKLLAIRPREKCNKTYSKNLEEKQLYQFYSLFEFDIIDGQPYKIMPTGHDHDIFNKYVHPENNLKINVSAIVGKNGSGKSTLTELLFLCCYLIAVKNGMLEIADSKRKGEKEQLGEMRSGLKVEIYFAIDDKYYCIVIDEDFIQPKVVESNIKFIDLWNSDKVPTTTFFYTIAINYSLYGLNETMTGIWVSRLFHKNDGYQTPVVISPFRDRGSINITSETHFAQTRLLSNLKLNRDQQVEIIPGKKVTDLYFVINYAKLSRVEGHHIDRVKEELSKATHKSPKAIFDETYQTMLGLPPNEPSLANTRWRELTINYVIGKLIRIAQNYVEYKKYFVRYSEEEVPGLQNIDDFLTDLKDDHTHITLKLRQALNFYRYDPLRVGEDGVRQSKDRIYIPVEIFAKRIKANREENPESDPMEFVPIAPFTPRLTLENDNLFHNLSSGEQQYIHSFQSIIYHILNLDSVFNNIHQSSKITYDCTNIVLDEIELYFHPEFQRMFVKDLLKTVSNLELRHITGINILFLTHSPFILSDIPSFNVLRMKNGGVEKDNSPTFAGNIHQMLTSSFFMEATTGDFARDQYQEILRLYEAVRFANPEELNIYTEQYQRSREKFKFIVLQIGEDVIKGVLENHLDYLDEQLIKGEASRNAQRQEIEQQIALLNQRLNDLDDKDQISQR